ncbi:MAG: hypothetical protein WAJ96_12995 [Candidatus Acidiferrum sp.]
MRLPCFAACGLCLTASLIAVSSIPAQEVGSVDLTQSSETVAAEKKTDSSAPSGKADKEKLPDGCAQVLPGIIGDGVVEPPDHELRPILVEVVKVSKDNPTDGSEIEAEVRLQNSGTKSIKIPWSTDTGIIETGQGPFNYEWYGGYFEVLFRAGNPNGVLLISSDKELYGSDLAAGSMLTLEPGQWATAKINFKMVAKYFPSDGAFEGQKAELFVLWREVQRSVTVKDCRGRNFYYRFEKFYEEEDRGIMIQVAGKAPNSSDKETKKPTVPQTNR